MSTFYIILFNKLFYLAILPSRWTFGNRTILYEIIGVATEPRIYRPTTFINCLGKLFPFILNDFYSE